MTYSSHREASPDEGRGDAAISLFSHQIKTRARDLGFDLVGIARAEALVAEGQRLQEWLGSGRQGQMRWMDRTSAKRAAPGQVLSGARSIISVAMNYGHPDACRGAFHISKYAQGEDYHRVLGPKLDDLCSWLDQKAPNCHSLWYVDTGPVMEKVWAQRAGLGWIGKHTNLINREIGSWLLLGVVLTTLELETDTPELDGCESCRICIDACPTGAIVGPYVIDANRCISYLTIEHRGEIEPELETAMGTHVFGCDVCQDVCPWNARAPHTREAAFSQAPVSWTEEALGEIDEKRFGEVFRTSAVKRAKWEGFNRNLRIARRNAERR